MVGRAFDWGFGGAVFKTIAHDNIKIVHPSPRMAGFNYGSKKLVGLQNVEQTSDRSMYDNFQDIKYLKKYWPEHIVIVSIMGFCEQEWEILNHKIQLLNLSIWTFMITPYFPLLPLLLFYQLPLQE